jgi:hypothetical protein
MKVIERSLMFGDSLLGKVHISNIRTIFFRFFPLKIRFYFIAMERFQKKIGIKVTIKTPQTQNGQRPMQLTKQNWKNINI